MTFDYALHVCQQQLDALLAQMSLILKVHPEYGALCCCAFVLLMALGTGREIAKIVTARR